MMLKP